MGVVPAVLAVALSGCTSTSAPSSDSTASIDSLCDDHRIVACDLSAESLSVTVGADVSDADTLSLVSDLYEIADVRRVADGATVTREAIGAPVLDPEFEAPAPWTLTVHPGSIEDAQSALIELLAVEDVAGTRGIGMISGWPRVTVDDIDQFADVFAEVSALPMFEAGGTYTLLSIDDRLRVVHTPRWVTPELVEEVIAISRKYPGAEVLLEAPEGGAQPPSLYISGLTPDEVSETDVRLADFGSGTALGTEVAYTLGSTGVDGVTYTTGRVGEGG